MIATYNNLNIKCVLLDMIYRNFGNSGFKCSAIGMGTYYDMRWIFKTYFGIYSNRDEKIEAIKTGIENGINLIDTAELYNTEKIIAEAIKDFKRDNLFIATKVFPTHLAPRSLEKAVNRSLKKLNTKYIDLYQIHFPSPFVDLKKTLKRMEKLIDDGKINNIGVSNFSLKMIKDSNNALSKHKLTSVQLDYNIFHKNIEKNGILEYCKKNNIVVMPYFPLGHGKVTKSYYNQYFDQIRRDIKDIPNANIALSYLISKNDNVFAIPRASNKEHVLQNIKYSDIILNDRQIKIIDDIKY